MSKPSIVQIRKKGGLQSIIKDKYGGSLNPKLYRSDSKNPDIEGTLEGDYKGKTILDTKHFIAPMWSDLRKRWSFEGSEVELSRLIDKMKLRYPKNHPNEGQVIRSSETDGERLGNRKDEVFLHPDFYGKYFMENGRVSLDLSDPKQDFLYRCYKGDHSVQDSTNKGRVSKYIASTTKYEIVSPKAENREAKDRANKEVEAIRLLAAMDGDERKMKAIATIMKLPLSSRSTDVNGLFLLLKDGAAQNVEYKGTFRKTYQERFIELAKLTDDELNITFQVTTARLKGILRKRGGHHLFNGEKLEGIESESQLFAFFNNPKNQDKYIELVDLLDDGN